MAKARNATYALLAILLATRNLACRQRPPPEPRDAAPAPTACVDAWLSARGLNEYGDPPGTMYAGGTPLFDERTGERRDRIALIVAKHPELAQSCPALSIDAGARP